jgi:hypothetical protein
MLRPIRHARLRAIRFYFYKEGSVREHKATWEGQDDDERVMMGLL